MTVSHSSQDHPDRLAREFRMPPPVIPKQPISVFTWLMMLFAVLVLVGLAVSFVRLARSPRPLLDVPGEAHQPEPGR